MWQMEFNVDKCEVIHFGQENGKTTYYLNEERLWGVLVLGDLGFLMHEVQKSGNLVCRYSK